ncbi:PAS domain-containing protein [Streptomyces sp. NBC_01369]|uniref:helix-turn-helix transcriptional regulator n=1 Tax=unclassified Streptomyces TaxID=2593676 RepID=UPI0022599CB4|nr:MULTISPECIES: PAS domain-containing protein [unclassified Streptomyces]MCX4869756.1 PAS domain-containing protein [Streptomyces sp. NBC_00906]MCX4900919.1 PAS domain-containing protein [Streptomyces sp. NBC_00892]
MENVEESRDDPRVRMWAPVCRAVALLLGPYAEVVLHDPETDRVLEIWNPMASRRPGDPSLLGELDELDPSARDVYGPYEKLLADGRRLSSVSAVLRDARDLPSAVLCINLDRTPLEQAAAVLSAFGAPTVQSPEPLFEQDWSERIQHVIGTYVRETGRPVERMTRQDRLAVLGRLDEARVFAVRRATPAVAGALRVSRSTVYGLLAELRAPSAKDRQP